MYLVNIIKWLVVAVQAEMPGPVDRAAGDLSDYTLAADSAQARPQAWYVVRSTHNGVNEAL